MVAVLTGAPPADASWPGGNGAIAYVSAEIPEDFPEPVGFGIHVRRVGQAPRRLTADPSDRHPSFSPDGRRVLFARSPAGGYLGDDIYSVGVDGESLRRLVAGSATEGRPGAFLVFAPLRRLRAVRPVPDDFGGRRDVIEPAWQPLPR